MCSDDPKINLGEESDAMMRAFIRNYPAMNKVISEGVMPMTTANVVASNFETPAMRNIGLRTDLESLEGAGGKLANEAVALDKSVNPEFYKSRGDVSSALGKLYDSVDVSGALSGGERSEIERSLNRQNSAGGITTPTPTSTIADAMTYGQASTARKLAQQGVLTGAVNAGAAAVPAMKSNIDPFKIATGRDSTPSTPAAAGMGAQLGGGLQNSLAGLSGNAMDANVSRRTGFEKFMASMPDYSG